MTNESDDRIEQRLRRYRPIGPAPSLRDRCLTPLPAARTWPWVAAAAALLMAILGLQSATAAAAGQVGISTASEPFERAVKELAEAFGGDETARQVARSMVEAELEHELATARPLPGDGR